MTQQANDGIRVVVQLDSENKVEVETIKGGLGEFSVFIDGQKVNGTNRLWYPTPNKILKEIRALLAE